MKISHILSHGTYFKGSTSKKDGKVPTKDGYEFYKDGILTKKMSYDFDIQRFLYSQYDKKGEKVTEEIRSMQGADYKDKLFYDKLGRLVRKEGYNSKGKLVSTLEKEYWGDSKQIKTTDYELGEGELKCVTKYAQNGNKISSKSSPYGEEEFIEYEYDDNNRLIRETTYDEQGERNYEIINTYNEKGILTDYVERNEDGEVEKQEKYDSETGKILKSYVAGDEDAKDAKIEMYKYDKRELLSEILTYEGGKFCFTTKYKYNTEGKLIKKMCVAQGALFSSEEFDPDTGNKIKESQYTGDGALLYREQNDFDEHGRQIRRTSMGSDGKISVVRFCDYDGDRLIEFRNPLARPFRSF